MKRILTLLVVLALLLAASLPAPARAAELPDCFTPTAMMMGFNTQLPMLFRTMGDPNPAGATAKYLLGNPEMKESGMRFSTDDGMVTLDADSPAGSFSPGAPAGRMTLTIGSGVNPIDASTLKMAFLRVVADSDAAVSYEDLLGWLPGAYGEDILPLNGYTLSAQRVDGGHALILTSDEAAGAPDVTEPAATATPATPATAAPAGPAELPRCFIPQEIALQFNSLLGPMLEMLGAPDPGTLAKQYTLTKADIVDNVLFLSSADGRVEINAFFEDGQPAVDRQASTLGLAMAGDVDRSELLSLGATFAYALSQMDESVGDFEALLDWMSDAVDAGGSAARPMNGYSMVYAKGQNGYMFTLVPDGGSGGAPGAELTQAPTVAPTAKPTPTPAPTQALPRSLENAFLEYGGLSIQLLKCETVSTGNVWLYFRILNTTDEIMRVQVNNATVNGVPVYATTIGNIDPRTDSESEDCLLTTYAEYESEGAAALADPRTVGLTIVIKDKDYHELTTQPITIDAGTLSVSPAAAPAASRKPAATPRATAKPYYYQSLSKGDRGDDVRRLQQKLIELGYLNDTPDGQFGPKTAAAVKAFNEANGFGSSQVATISMQELLFSAKAKAWSEPWIPIEVPRTEWRNITGEGGSYRFKIQNTSKTRTIKGIAVRYYPTDVWGNKLWDYSYRETTFNVTIKPGKSGWTQWLYMTPSWYTIENIHIGIAKVAFSDGTIHENDNVTYDWYVTLH